MPGISDLMGAAGGAGLGAATGGASSLIPAAVGLATSVVQGIGAAKSRKKADAAMPGLVDPRQAAFLAELNQKRKSIDTGADFATGMNKINATNASTNEALTRASGGDVAATMQGLISAQRAAGDSTNDVLSQGQNQQMQYNSMFNDLNNKIAARSMQLQLQKSQQHRAEWAQKKQAANQNFMGAIGSLTGKAPAAANTSAMTAPPMNGTPVPSADAGDQAAALPSPDIAPASGGDGSGPMPDFSKGGMDTSFLDNFSGMGGAE